MLHHHGYKASWATDLKQDALQGKPIILRRGTPYIPGFPGNKRLMRAHCRLVNSFRAKLNLLRKNEANTTRIF